MTGYPEAMTDPSYFGQILIFTFPLIGNYGVPPANNAFQWQRYYESPAAKISGLIVEDYSADFSHFQAETSLAQWLYNQKVPGIAGIDTRALTRKIREQGVMSGKIVIDNAAVPFSHPNQDNLVKEVSPKTETFLGKGKKRILLLDCGAKQSIIDQLLQRDVQIIRAPWNFPIREAHVEGIVLSSGPGDPKMCKATVTQAALAFQKGIPTLGICLGHQIMALAAGGDTFKMKYGHRSQNQPVLDTITQKAYITSQNHGYAVNITTLPKCWRPLFTNLNDQTCEGLVHKSGKFFSAQFHPEASPGPMDTAFLFDRFIDVL